MDEILTKMSTSISAFKQNPNREVRLAGDEPFAVLTNNRPSFYVLSPKAYDDLLEKIWELEITPEVLERSRDPKSIPVTIEQMRSGEIFDLIEGED